MLGWIPIVGPIIDGLVSIFNKKQDADVEKHKVDGAVRETELKTSQEILSIFKDDVGVRFSRDLVIVPTSTYCALTVWDYMVVLKYPELVWGVKAIPVESGLAWLPYAVLVFLLGNTYLNRTNK